LDGSSEVPEHVDWWDFLAAFPHGLPVWLREGSTLVFSWFTGYGQFSAWQAPSWMGWILLLPLAGLSSFPRFTVHQVRFTLSPQMLASKALSFGKEQLPPPTFISFCEVLCIGWKNERFSAFGLARTRFWTFSSSVLFP